MLEEVKVVRPCKVLEVPAWVANDPVRKPPAMVAEPKVSVFPLVMPSVPPPRPKARAVIELPV